MGTNLINPASDYKESQLLVFKQTLQPGQTALDISRTIDKDSDFLWLRLHGKSTGSYDINVRLPSGAQWANVMVPNDCLVGTVSAPQFVDPCVYLGGSRIPIDLVDTSNAVNYITLIFGGMRKYRVSS